MGHVGCLGASAGAVNQMLGACAAHVGGIAGRGCFVEGDGGRLLALARAEACDAV
jgi:hypothetical protein